jgi:hypothetical protein
MAFPNAIPLGAEYHVIAGRPNLLRKVHTRRAASTTKDVRRRHEER